AAPPQSGQNFQTLLNNYLQGNAQVPGSVTVTQAGGPGSATTANSDERSLDVSIIAANDPNTTLVLYAGGNGLTSYTEAAAQSALQTAIWDDVNSPPVISSSFGSYMGHPSGNSVFWWADEQLVADAALRNITLLTSNGDTGSGYGFGSGLPNVST